MLNKLKPRQTIVAAIPQSLRRSPSFAISLWFHNAIAGYIHTLTVNS
ncbi:hypothetical protein [Kamptonema animale]|nr:hypothetical protein [Kamptonema animale]